MANSLALLCCFSLALQPLHCATSSSTWIALYVWHYSPGLPPGSCVLQFLCLLGQGAAVDRLSLSDLHDKHHVAVAYVLHGTSRNSSSVRASVHWAVSISYVVEDVEIIRLLNFIFYTQFLKCIRCHWLTREGKSH